MSTEIDESVVPDTVDEQILRALQLAPRAPFAEIAGVVGLSETAVARRWRRLTGSGVARVVGNLDTAALGRSQWIVHLRCRPGTVDGIATGLAGRADVPWVAVTGNEQVTCLVTARAHEERVDLLAMRLPRTRAVENQESAMVLHRFDGPGNASARPDGRISLEPADEILLARLAQDGRTSVAALAAEVGESVGRTARRLARLLRAGVVRVSTEIASAALGLRACAVLRMQCDARAVRTTGEALAHSPHVALTYATTGAFALHALVLCRDLDTLFTVTTDEIGALPGLRDLEVLPVLEQRKQNGLRVDDGLFTLPAAGRQQSA